jgi:amidase
MFLSMATIFLFVFIFVATSWASYAEQRNSTCILNADPLQQPYPDSFPLQDAAGTAALFPTSTCLGVILEEATIDQLQGYMSDGVLTSVDLLRCYLKRVHQVDKYINSVIELNPDAQDIAMALDVERATGRTRGPLHGIPFIVKDNIATKDQMETTAGSWALLGSVVPRDAHVVTKLRAAGALLMGKATLSEWADMRSNNYSEGYSARGGQARSPYNLTLNPGGSSSGSAAAVAANAVSFALGKPPQQFVEDNTYLTTDRYRNRRQCYKSRRTQCFGRHQAHSRAYISWWSDSGKYSPRYCGNLWANSPRCCVCI